MSHDNAVQVSYERILDDGLPGSKADANPTTIDSFIAEGGDIPYGVVISKGASETRGGTLTARIGATGGISATAGTMLGTGALADIPTLNAITDGMFDITIDGSLLQVIGMDFSAQTDYAGIATIIETQIVALGGAGVGVTVAYDADHGAFLITSGTTGATSTVSDGAPGTGAGTTDTYELLGIDSGDNTDGLDTQSVTVLGVVYRSVTHESTSVAQSNTVSVKEGQIGAYQIEGRIKVLAVSGGTDGDDVYFDDATGEIYNATAVGRTQLGSAKFRGTTQAGKVGIIDVKGL